MISDHNVLLTVPLGLHGIKGATKEGAEAPPLAKSYIRKKIKYRID